MEVNDRVNESWQLQGNTLNRGIPLGVQLYPPSSATAWARFLVFHFHQEQTLRRSFHAGLSTVARIEKCGKGLR